MATPDKLKNDLEEIRKSSAVISSVLEREIIKSRYVISALANVLEDGLIVLDAERKITVLNNAAASMLSLDPDKAVGKVLSDLFPDAFSEDLKVINKEWVVIDEATGLPRYIEIVVSPLSSSELSDPSYVLTARDVTFKRSNEYKVLDLSSFQNNLIASIPVPTFYTDKNGGYIRGSQSFYEFVGIPRLKALAKNVEDLFDKSTSRWFKDIRIPFDAKNCNVKTHEGERSVILYKNLLKTPEGNVIGLIGCLVDTSSIPIDEVSNIVLQALEMCPDPIALVSYPSGSIFLINKQFSQVYGYPKSEARGLSYVELLGNPSQFNNVIPKLVRSIRKRAGLPLTLDLKTKSGKIVTEKLLVLPIFKSGQHTCHYCMIVRE